MKFIRDYARRVMVPGFTICFFLLGIFLLRGAAEEREVTEARVYVMKNQAAGNTIAVFKRGGDGSLSLLQEVPTGGLGSGPGTFPPPAPNGTPGPNGIDSQDSLVITDDGRFLIAVNPNSNDVSVLEVIRDGLRLVDRVPSGGIFPVSIAHHHNLIYVLNGGAMPHSNTGTPTLRGFRLDHEGKLHEIHGSTILTGPNGSQPTDTVFSASGKILIISEQTTQTIKVFRVGDGGLLQESSSFLANNSAPVAVAVGPHGIVGITEGAISGPRIPIPNGSTVSSYRVTDEDTLELVSKSVPTDQTAACWLRFTPDGRYAYTGNTGSGSVSSFSVSEDGELTLLNPVANFLGFESIPIDLSITPDGKFLYIIGSFIGTIRGYQIENDGSLIPVASFSGLPISMQGIVAQ
jgi:6-phosphogluconolactonase (cycloisomerase 2 family)